MNQIEVAVKISRHLETLLEKNYQATGKGLHEKVTSVESRLDEALVKQLRYIATIRNSVVHEDGFIIADLAKFVMTGDAAVVRLGGKPDATLTLGTQAAWAWYLDITTLLLATVAGAGVGIWNLGFWPGILGAIGGFVVAAVVTSDEAKRLYKATLEFVFGLFILACVWLLASSVWKWLA